MEEWKDIEGYEGLYQISNYGRVKALERKIEGKGKNQFVKEHLLKPHISLIYGKERLQTCLYKNGTKKYLVIARLVYTAFKGHIPFGIQINHIDENPSNNHIDNLELMTPKENSNWGTRNSRIGETFKTNGKRSKAVVQYTTDGKIVGEYPSAKEAGRHNGFSQCNISRCCNGGFLYNGKWINVNKAYGFIWKYKNG